MFTGILVPVDGSKLGERALAVAVPLAEQHGAKLVLLHVHEPVLPLAMGGGAPVQDRALEMTWREDSRKYLERLAKRVRKQTSAAVESVFRDGDIVQTIAQEVATQGAGLVVMSTHGRGGLQRFFLGSVSDGLMRHLEVPLLLLRAARGAKPREAGLPVFSRVVVPLDGSPRAERALPVVTALLSGSKAALTLAHVVHPMTAVAAAQLPRRDDLDITPGYLEPLAARLRTPTLAVQYETTVDGNVARALKEMAKKHDADLIAMTSQGMSGFQRFVVGSVADKLIRTADQAVLLVPSKE